MLLNYYPLRNAIWKLCPILEGQPVTGRVTLAKCRVKGVVSHYDAPEPQPSLKQLGYVD
jgi:hypothetical protein